MPVRKLSFVIQRKFRERIFTIRVTQVMIDRDSAEIYGVSTKVLNQAGFGALSPAIPHQYLRTVAGQLQTGDDFTRPFHVTQAFRAQVDYVGVTSEIQQENKLP